MPRRGTTAAMTGSNTRQRDRRHHERGPDERGVQRQKPSREQSENAGGRGQRATQIVQHLPLAEQRQRTVAASRSIAATEQPGQQLPVAARPAMIARDPNVVARRKLFHDFDIGYESGACKGALEQIMTEQRALRHSAGKRRFERIDVVDSFARVRAFAKQILVHVRHGRAVRIDAGHPREDALKERALAADRQRRRHARLQHGIALDDAALRPNRTEDDSADAQACRSSVARSLAAGAYLHRA